MNNKQRIEYAEKRIKEQLKKIGLDENHKIEIVNSTDKEKREKYFGSN